MISRRDFGKAALAGIPVAAGWSAEAAVRVGVATDSYRDLVRTPGRDNVDDVVKAVQLAGVQEIELSSTNTEPAGPNSGPAAPPPPSAYPDPIRTPSPAEVAAAKLAVRNALRKWRLETDPRSYEAIRAKFQAAGISVFAYRIDYGQTFTDDEIDVTFRQAKALGVARIASMTTMSMARRLAGYAERYDIEVAIHNGASSKDGDAIASPQRFREALGLSKRFRLNFDIGNFTAAGFEAVAFLQENHASVSHIQVKDRTRTGGNEKFGDGDTPIGEALKVVRDKRLAIPVFVEYEYIGLGTPQDEVRRCLAFVKSALA